MAEKPEENLFLGLSSTLNDGDGTSNADSDNGENEFDPSNEKRCQT